jgi:hypothetical protein
MNESAYVKARDLAISMGFSAGYTEQWGTLAPPPGMNRKIPCLQHKSKGFEALGNRDAIQEQKEILIKKITDLGLDQGEFIKRFARDQEEQ